MNAKPAENHISGKQAFIRSTLPYAVVRVADDPAHPAQTRSGRVQRKDFTTRDPALPLKGQAGSSLATGHGGQGQSTPDSTKAGRYWDVHQFAFPAGVGKRLGRVRATTRAEAEALALVAHGPQILVTLSGGKTRRDTLGRPYHRPRNVRHARQKQSPKTAS